MPVSLFSSVTVTPGSTAPLESRMTPSTAPVSNCAHTGAHAIRQKTALASTLRISFMDGYLVYGSEVYKIIARRDRFFALNGCKSHEKSFATHAAGDLVVASGDCVCPAPRDGSAHSTCRQGARHGVPGGIDVG